MILRFKHFLEKNSSDYDQIIELYSHFIRILRIHENFYYKNTKISNNENFKKDINSIFDRLTKGKGRTEDLYNLVNNYEKDLYNDDLMTKEENHGCSMWDVCDVIIEDPDTLNINRYIQDFSEEDIYCEEDFNPDFKLSFDGNDEIPNILNMSEEDFIKKQKSLHSESFVEKMVDIAFDKAKEKYEDEIDIIDFALDMIESFKDDYPEYKFEFQEMIDDWKKFRNKF
jgi:hypothetical protein